MAKDYSKLEKDDLLKVIMKLESRKKYGLVWDEEKTKEQFEKESENALPVLKEVKGKEIKTDASKPTNILIEGDNYHALSVLNYTHQGKVDVIYIDPPYNTGNKDFVYNDDYVDKDDEYKHSKWLSFMNKRLRIAKPLLKDSGTIFISIDDKEYPRLVMLLEEIFKEEYIKTICVKMSEATGVKMASVVKNGRIPKLKEYLVIAKKDGIHNLYLEKLPKEKWDDEYKTLIINATEEQINEVKEIRDNDDRIEGDLQKSNEIISEWQSVSLLEYFKLNNIAQKNQESFKYKNAWRIIQIVTLTGGARDIAAKKKLSFKNIPNYFCITTPRKKMYLISGNFNHKTKLPRCKLLFADDYLTVHPGDFWSDIKTTGLDNEGGVDFKNGKKPLKLIERVLKTNRKKDITVLDFFAGSGTTAEAVLKLNKEDNGNRKFIICTYNKENNSDVRIIDDYCLPRVFNSLKKYGSKNVLGGNLKYYKTAFVKNSISRDNLKIRITHKCTEMLCLREGIFDEVKARIDYRIFEQNGRVMAVYYALEQNRLEQLKKDLDKMKGEKILYCFTLDPLGLNKNDFVDWEGISLEPIPQKILDIYEQIYEY